MRSYCPNCRVWVNGRVLSPTDKEVEDYHLNIAKILANEHKVVKQHTEALKDEPLPVVVPPPELEPEDTTIHAMLLDPSLFESDSDL